MGFFLISPRVTRLIVPTTSFWRHTRAMAWTPMRYAPLSAALLFATAALQVDGFFAPRTAPLMGGLNTYARRSFLCSGPRSTANLGVMVLSSRPKQRSLLETGPSFEPLITAQVPCRDGARESIPLRIRAGPWNAVRKLKPLIGLWYALLLVANVAPFVLHFLQDMGLAPHHFHFTPGFNEVVLCLSGVSVLVKLFGFLSNGFGATRDWLCYLTRSRRPSVMEKEAEYIRLFEAMDTNGDGFVSQDEMVRAMHRIAKAVAEQVPNDLYFLKVWNDMDSNRDGFVSRDEFVESQFRRDITQGDRTSL